MDLKQTEQYHTEENVLVNKLDKSAGGTVSSCVRMELVKKYRKEINEKTYKIKSEEIATKMARELFNGKSSTSRINFKS